MEAELPDPRFWDKAFEDWLLDQESNEKPGPHPWPNHLWNKFPEMYDLNEHEKY